MARSLIAVLFVGVAVALYGCGGGGENPESAGEVKASQAGDAPSTFVSPVPGPDIAVDSLRKVSERRISRTVFEYVYRVRVVNHGGATAGAVISLDAVPEGTTIVDGKVAFRSVPAGSTTAYNDTITIQHERTRSFDISKLIWTVSLATADPVVRVTPTISPDVPETLSIKIRQLLSTASAARPGQSLFVPAQPSTSIIAVDDRGIILAAGRARLGTEQVVLDRESTALELTRWILAGSREIPAGSALESEIRALPRFAALVGEVGEAFSAGVSPFSRPSVIASLTALGTELLTPVQIASRPTARADRERMLAITPERHSGAGPVPLVRVPGSALQAVSALDSSFRLESTHPIAWAARVRDHDGTPLRMPGNSSTEFIVEPYLVDGLARAVFEAASPSPKSRLLPDNDGKPVTLEIFQSPQTVKQNLFVLVGGAASAVLGVQSDTSCIKGIGELLLGDSPELAALLVKPEANGLRGYVNSRLSAWAARTGADLYAELITSGRKTIAKGCFTGWDPEKASGHFLPKIAASWAASLWVTLDALDKAVSAIQYVQMAGVVFANLSFEPAKRIGICFGSGWKIESCNDRLEITPASVVMTPGASLPDVRIKAFNGPVETALPELTLEVASSNLNAVLALRSPGGGVMLEADRLGESLITARDKATGSTTQLTARVTQPRFASDKITVQKGQTVEVSIVGNDGANLDANGPTRFYSEDTRIATVRDGANGTSPSRSKFLKVSGAEAGLTRIVAENMRTGSSMILTVEVVSQRCVTPGAGEFTVFRSRNDYTGYLDFRDGNCVGVTTIERDPNDFVNSVFQIRNLADGSTFSFATDIPRLFPGARTVNTGLQFSERLSMSGRSFVTVCQDQNWQPFICVMSTDASVIPRALPGRQPFISGDGSRVFATTEQGDILATNLASGDIACASCGRSGPRRPRYISAVSSDGNSVLAQDDSIPGYPGVFVLYRQINDDWISSELPVINGRPGIEFTPAGLSPDGRRLVFMGRRNGFGVETCESVLLNLNDQSQTAILRTSLHPCSSKGVVDWDRDALYEVSRTSIIETRFATGTHSTVGIIPADPRVINLIDVLQRGSEAYPRPISFDSTVKSIFFLDSFYNGYLFALPPP